MTPREQWVEAYVSGRSVCEIAAESGCHTMVVLRHLWQTISLVRSSTAAAKARRCALWAEAHRDGHRIADIARRWGVKWDTVADALNRPRVRRAA